jgi:hypothetical protein
MPSKPRRTERRTATSQGDAPAAGAAGSQVIERTVVEYVDADAEKIAQRYGNGDKDAALRKLWKSGFNTRKERDALKEQLEAATPKDGSKMLKPDEVKEWDAFKALGKPAAEIKTTLESHATLAQKVSEGETTQSATEAAKAMGWNADALLDLGKTKQLKFSVKKEKNDAGQEVEVAYVQTSEQGSTPVKLSEYAPKNLSVYLPALTTSASAGNSGDARRTTQYVQQSSATETQQQKAQPGTQVPGGNAYVTPGMRKAKP